MELREYQKKAVADVEQAWRDGHYNVMYVLPCRGGKTVIASTIIRNNTRGMTVAIAHRSTLVAQMARTLARNGIAHRIIGNVAMRRDIIKSQLKEFGRSYVDEDAHVVVASVGTIVKMDEHWFDDVSLWLVDEGHHLTEDNQWGKVIAKFTNAKGLAITATPRRADNKGLGRGRGGVIDKLIEGPNALQLSAGGFLAPFRVVLPKISIDTSNLPVAAGGDFSPVPLSDAARKSTIAADVVDAYLKYCPNAKAVVFCVDVNAAMLQRDKFAQAGISAAMLCGETPILEQIRIQQLHQNRQIKVICNVDLYGEGVDIPDLEAVILARPTKSLALHIQQSMRPLNPIVGKIAMIIDLVGNVMSGLGLPTTVQVWSLDGKRKEPGLLKVRRCDECAAVYERVEGPVCPFCGYERPPAPVKEKPLEEEIDEADGELDELSPEAIAKLTGAINKVLTAPRVPVGATPEIRGAIMKRHREHLLALTELKAVMALWAAGMNDLPHARRLFYLTFGIDVATAQTLPKKDMIILTNRILNNEQ